MDGQLAAEKKNLFVWSDSESSGHDHEPAVCPDGKGKQQLPRLYERKNCWRKEGSDCRPLLPIC